VKGGKIITGRVVNVYDHGQKCDVVYLNGFSEKGVDIMEIQQIDEVEYNQIHCL